MKLGSGKALIQRVHSTRWKWLTFQCSSIACACLLLIIVVPSFVGWLRPQREAEQDVKRYGYNAPLNQTFLELLPPNGSSDDTTLMAEVRGAALQLARKPHAGCVNSVACIARPCRRLVFLTPAPLALAIVAQAQMRFWKLLWADNFTGYYDINDPAYFFVLGLVDVTLSAKSMDPDSLKIDMALTGEHGLLRAAPAPWPGCHA